MVGICTGKKIGAYLSDISAAFDRVFKYYLLAKLHRAGVGSTYLNFLEAYLSPRQARVVVQGAVSETFSLGDQVFQGTVLGPPLWNSFFADVAVPASSTGGQETIFADDLNVFNFFDQHEAHEIIEIDLTDCRDRMHT